jgi:hypothetical protein
MEAESLKAMKATLLLGVAILIASASISAAAAKVDRACLRQAEQTFGATVAKRICDRKNYAKPDQFGWICEVGDSGVKYRKVKGGALRKGDAVCE